MRRLWPAAALVAFQWDPTAAAPLPSAPHEQTLQGEEAVQAVLRALIVKQRWADGLALIAHFPPEVRDRSPYLYLRAQLLRKAGRRHEALDLYNRLLSRDESQQLVRLELAQTYYEVGDDRAAEQYFRLALSGPLTPADAAQVHGYLARIKTRSDWHVSANVGVAPDSNVNAATSAQTVTLYGLPFQLSDQARRQGSWALDAGLSVGRSVAIAGPLRAAGEAYGQWVDNFNAHAFDELILGARAGPQWAFGESSVSLLGGYEQMRYGGSTLYTMPNVTVRAEFPVAPTVLYRVTASEQRFTYPVYSDYSGWATTAAAERTQYLSPTRFWRLTASFSTDHAQVAYQSYNAGRVAVGFFSNLPLGLAAYVEPSLGVSDYAAPQPVFDIRRVDATASASARLILRDRTVYGFAPYLGLLYLRTKSSIDLFSYERERAEVGFARTF